MQALSLWDVMLSLTLSVDEASGLLGFLIKPAGDVGACYLDKWLYLW